MEKSSLPKKVDKETVGNRSRRTSGGRAPAESVDSLSSSASRQKALDGLGHGVVAQKGQCLQSRINDSRRLKVQRKTLASAFGAAIQRQPEDDRLRQEKSKTLQRAAKEDDELGQAKFATLQRVEDDESAHGRFEPVQKKTENGTGLPDTLKAGIESLSGMDMSDVRVHYHSSKPAQLNALAYAQGKEIHLGAGQEQHLPHEAWHVVQQAQGRVSPTGAVAGSLINDDATLESEADEMGARAVQAKGAPRHMKAEIIKPQKTLQRATLPPNLVAHEMDFAELKSSINGLEDATGDKTKSLDSMAQNADSWADETRLAAKRKYEEYYSIEVALENKKTATGFGVDTTLETDTFSMNQYTEVKLVSGSWSQLSANLLKARKQLHKRVPTGKTGIAWIALDANFFADAQSSLGYNNATAWSNAISWIQTANIKKMKSKGANFGVRLCNLVTNVHKDIDISHKHK